jgi:hypothetical protein
MTQCQSWTHSTGNSLVLLNLEAVCLYRVKTRASLRWSWGSTRAVVWHSQTTITAQPARRRCRATSRSRRTLSRNFFCQRMVAVRGTLVPDAQECRCQKHPWTKRTVCRSCITKSGCPGSDLRCRAKRTSSCFNIAATASSHRLPVDLMRDIRSLRSASERVSIRAVLDFERGDGIRST